LNPGFATHGVRALGGPAAFYVSRESHLAWLKIAHQAGLGRSAVRLVATDGSGRMDIAALAAAIAADRDRGCVPFMIAATAGTTNAGMIDPLRDCIGLAEANGLWCHVDAAWGGGLIASSTHRARLAGIEQADSVTVDAHKWFATTMGCGMFLTRWPGLLASAFTASASYMPSNIPDADPYVNSVQWSRRFLGLRLFLSLAAAGWDGYGRHVEHALSMIDLLRQRLTMRGWRIANTSETGVLCIVPPDPGAVPKIVRRVVESGRAWISVAMFEGEQVIRACVCNGTTSEQDIATLEEALTADAEPIY
jgi:glutamate/tyrosine decarboxylase-like PLP-dependent enzyme